MPIKDWDTVDANNDSIPDTSINMEEGMAPSLYNDSWRAIMSDIRLQHENAEWIGLGDDITWVNGTQFKVSGNLTATYAVDRYIQMVGDSTGTITGQITNSSYGAPDTTVTVTWDSGSMVDEDLEAYLYILNLVDVSPDIEAGTVKEFFMATAPEGWTLDTSTEWNQIRKMIVDKNNGGTYAGSDDALRCDEVPTHTHGGISASGSTTTNGNHSHSGGGNAGCNQGSGDNNLMSCGRYNTGSAGNHSHSFSFSVTTGNPSSYEDWTPRYAKFIMATKD